MQEKGDIQGWYGLRHEDMKDLRCMSFTSKDSKEILIAGLQDQMFLINVDKGEIIKQVWELYKKGSEIC